MQAHEVPTHVQAEDKVLLWFTFPQIVAITAVGALAYGLYNYLPFGPPGFRIGLAVIFALTGLTAVVGKVGGRRLPAVVADLLRYRLAGRHYAGTAAEIVRSEPPAPLDDSPGLLQHMTEKAQRRLRRMRRGLKARRVRRSRERRNGRRAPRPGRWFQSRRGPEKRRNDGGIRPAVRGAALLAALALLAVTSVAASGPSTPTPEPTPGPGTPYPQTSPERWRNEVEFDPVEPVPGRRLYVERLAVFEERATVTLRAAADIELQVHAFGGPEGEELHYHARADVAAGERVVHTLPLSGDAPSFTFAWVDALGLAGAVSLDSTQIPHPLPVAEGELCDVRVTSVRLSPGAITGSLAANECIDRIEHPIDIEVVKGYVNISGAMMMKTRVTDVYGSVTISSGESSTTVQLDPPDSATFRLTVPTGKALHELTVEATIEAHLRASAPPVVTLEFVPEKVEDYLVPVEVLRPGTSKVVSESVAVYNDNGDITYHDVSARLTIPSEVITVVPVVTLTHPEHILATVSPRGSVYGSKEETVQSALAIGSDAPYAPFVPPPREEEPPPPVQTPATDDESRGLFDLFGWTWPW